MKERLFLIVAFLISWGIELALLLTGHVDDAIYNWISPLIAFGPALAVLVTKYVIKEPLGMNLWFKPEGRKTLKYVLAGWFGPLIPIAVGVCVYFLIFHNQFDSGMGAMIESLRGQNDLSSYSDAQIRSTLYRTIIINILMSPFYNIFTCVTEEFGWRGYLLNALCEHHPKWRAVLLNGVLWGIWYIPLAAMQTFAGKSYDGNLVLGVIYLVVYAMIYSIVFAAIYSYLTLKTHSCVPAILANACITSMGNVGLLFMKEQGKVNTYLNPTNTSIIGGIGFILLAVLIFYLLAKDKVEPAPMKEEVANMKRMDEVAKRAKNRSGSLKSHTQNEHLKEGR